MSEGEAGQRKSQDETNVAWHRGVGDDRLLDIAVRVADRVDAEFGAGGAIPYHAWANRRVEGMRVWIPR